MMKENELPKVDIMNLMNELKKFTQYVWRTRIVNLYQV